jgi:hypothetical protein
MRESAGRTVNTRIAALEGGRDVEDAAGILSRRMVCPANQSYFQKVVFTPAPLIVLIIGFFDY